MRVESANAPRGALRFTVLFHLRHAKAFRNAYRSVFLSGVSAPARIGALRLWCLALLLVIPRLAWASHGGTDLCEVLGWEPKERRVYVLRHNGSEGGPFWTLAYFDLKADRPCRQTIKSQTDVEEESTVRRNIASLVKGLKPLTLLREPTMWNSRVVGADSLPTEYGKTPRFHVELTGLRTEKSYSTLRVTTYVSPSAFVPRVYSIPGRPEKLGIVVFTGVWWETGYETQVPVLLQSSCGDTLDVEWKDYGE